LIFWPPLGARNLSLKTTYYLRFFFKKKKRGAPLKYQKNNKAYEPGLEGPPMLLGFSLQWLRCAGPWARDHGLFLGPLFFKVKYKFKKKIIEPG
jgi:hypothetical protein